MSFNVSGLDDLLNTLSILSNPETVDAALIKGLTKAGKQVQGTAKALCPVDTGQLRNSIEVTPIANGIDVGTNVEYAPYVEYGTGKRGDSSVAHRTDWEGMRPQPFLYPAVEANKENIRTIVSQEIQNEINKAVK